MKNNKMLIVGFIALIFGAVAQIDASAQLIIFNASKGQAFIMVSYQDAFRGDPVRGMAGPYYLQAGETKNIEVDDGRLFYFAAYMQGSRDNVDSTSGINLGAGESSSWKLIVDKDGGAKAVLYKHK